MAEVARSRIGSTTHLLPDGSLNDGPRTERLREAIEACIADRELRIVLDLSEAPLLDSVALETLVDAQDQLVRIGGGIRIAHPGPVARDVLRMTGLDDHLAVLEAEPAAPAPVGGEWRRIGEILGDLRYITDQQRDAVLKAQRRLTEG